MSLSDTFRAVSAKVASGRLGVSYFPYRELKHTWRCVDGSTVFRVSDYMRDSPEEVLESLAWYLICKARGKECPQGMAERYLRHVRSADFWASRRDQYISRARNLTFRAKGGERDLGKVFDYVNSFHFSGQLARPELAWARESPRRRVGFFHSALRILAVNKALDSASVPRYVLEFVVYHELLHSVLDVEDGKSRRVRHTAEFKRMEERFARYPEAQAWLSKIAARR